MAPVRHPPGSRPRRVHTAAALRNRFVRRQILRRWTAENGLAADGPLSALDGIPAENIEWLAVRVFRWLVNPSRKLVTGMTLAELACRRWWGHPCWPDLVEKLLIVLDDPADEHWGQGGEFRRRLDGADILSRPECWHNP